MPVITTLNNVLNRLLVLKDRVTNPELAVKLGQELADEIGLAFVASGVRSRTGSAFDAITTVGEPQKVAAGWRVTVGDERRMGKASDQAPRGTLKEFFENMKLRPSPWKYIPEAYKQKLEALRRAGMYGGRGPDYANYVWAQENGNARAFIPPRKFIETGSERWKARRGQIINDWFRRA